MTTSVLTPTFVTRQTQTSLYLDLPSETKKKDTSPHVMMKEQNKENTQNMKMEFTKL